MKISRRAFLLDILVFNRGFTAVFGVLAGLRKIGVRALNNWVRIAVSELAWQAAIAGDGIYAAVVFGSTFRFILIAIGIWHDYSLGK
ncbi:MAG: hypothetical protein DMG76_05985 [Acidobacteria bacterium]|nr:MAG: hypothetical protein DMG76_05985 [Acidobacteriota bacterium]